MADVWAVIASGASLTHDDVALIRRAREDGVLAGVAAVSNVGIDLAPWAECLVSHDSAWWAAHPEALEFKGEKVGGNAHPKGGIRFQPTQRNGCNSGLMAMEYVWREHGAKRLIIIGFDMHGSHYFGKHTRAKLKNTSEQRFKYHLAQFHRWDGCPVINCTPGSSLKYFPFKPLAECLVDLAAAQA